MMMVLVVAVLMGCRGPSSGGGQQRARGLCQGRRHRQQHAGEEGRHAAMHKPSFHPSHGFSVSIFIHGVKDTLT